MGAAAISTRTKRPRPAAKPRTATKPHKATKPRAKTKPTAAKPRATAKPKAAPKSQAATKARATAAARSRARTQAAAKPRASAARVRGSAAVATAVAPGRSRAMPATGLRALAPVVAVGRTATAFGGIADCGLVVGMTRGRAWIVVLGILLGGIVALNVWGLSLSASSSATAAKIDQFERDNSVLRTRKATKLSNAKIEAAAAQLGLTVPAADQVEYLKASDSDINRAAKRLAEGAIAAVATAVTPSDVVDPAIDPVTGAPVDPAADPALEAPTADTPLVAPTDPVTTDTTTDPVTTDSATTDPATTDPATTDTSATTTPPATDPATGAVAP